MSLEVCHYVVSSHPPGGVLECCYCNFTSGQEQQDLLIAKSRRLEIHSLPATTTNSGNRDGTRAAEIPSGGDSTLTTIPIHGRIIKLLPFTLPGHSRSLLFVLTSKFQYAILGYNTFRSRSGQQQQRQYNQREQQQYQRCPYPVDTIASGSFENTCLGRQAECAPLVDVDTVTYSSIVLHLYQGFLTLLPLHPHSMTARKTGRSSSLSSLLGTPHHIRIEQVILLDLKFMLTPSSSTPAAAAAAASATASTEMKTAATTTLAAAATTSSKMAAQSLPQLCLLHQDAHGHQHVTCFALDMDRKALHAKLWHKSRVDGGSSLLISTRNGGILILGQAQVTLLQRDATQMYFLPLPTCIILSYSRQIIHHLKQDEERFFLSDEFGYIHLLSVSNNNNHNPRMIQKKKNAIKLELDTLGATGLLIQHLQFCSTNPKTGAGNLFCGSAMGDSLWLELTAELQPDTRAYFVSRPLLSSSSSTTTTLVATSTSSSLTSAMTNLGPIVDMDWVISPKTKYSASVVTASGTSLTGSVRLIRNGIGMKETASVELPGILNMWAIRQSHSDLEHVYMVQAFVGETRVLGIASPSATSNDEEMKEEEFSIKKEVEGDSAGEEDEEGATLEEVILPGLDSDSCSTLFMGNVEPGDALLQITERQVRVFAPFKSNNNNIVLDTWSPPLHNEKITVASANEAGQIVVALRGGQVTYLEIISSDDKVEIKVRGDSTTLGSEVSCLNLNPLVILNNNDSAKQPSATEDVVMRDVGGHNDGRRAIRSKFVAVGLWDDFTVRVLSLQNSALPEVLQINLGTNDDEQQQGESNPTSPSGAAKSDSPSFFGSPSPMDTTNNSNNALTQNRNNMMARSLCFVTMDHGNNNSVSNANASLSSSVHMLFVGLGDGTLISFAVSIMDDDTNIIVQSKKEVNLGTQRIHIVPLYTPEKGTCVFCTGDRPTVIYLAGGGAGGGNNNNGNNASFRTPKLCYSHVKLEDSHLGDNSNEDDDDEYNENNNPTSSPEDMTVNVATPFLSSKLFDAASAGTNNPTPSSSSSFYSLAMSDDSMFRLGMIDDIQKLHVTTCRLGMAPRRIVHCPEGRLFAVGCIESGIQAHQPHQKQQQQPSPNHNMGNCIRFLDDTTLEDLERVDLEPFEIILSIAHVNLQILQPDVPGDSSTTANLKSDEDDHDNAKIDGNSADDDDDAMVEDVVHNNDGGKQQSSSSASSSSKHEVRPFVLVGTAYAFPDEHEPSRGRILVFSCCEDEHSATAAAASATMGSTTSSGRSVKHVTECHVHGGVYAMCQFFNGMLMATVNTKAQILQLSNEVTGEDGSRTLRLNFVGIGHHGHILSLLAKSRASLLSAQDHQKSLGAAREQQQQSSKKKRSSKATVEQEQLAIVGDVMRSISLVKYYPEHKALEEIARDFHASWTTAIEMLTDHLFLGAENWNNIYLLRRNSKSLSEEVRCRLDTVGQFHLGEMVNKFMPGSLTMQHASASTMTTTFQQGNPNSSSGKSNAMGRRSSGASGTTTARKKSAATMSSPNFIKKKSNTNVTAANNSNSRARRPIVRIGSQTLFGTVDGTLGSILGLDAHTAAFFITLERAMNKVIEPVGNFSHADFRTFNAERRVMMAEGFVDGDFVESFLDFERPTMELVVEEMNRDGGYEIDSHHHHSKSTSAAGGGGNASRSRFQDEEDDDDDDEPNDNAMPADGNLVVEDVLAMLEEMTMLH